MLPRSQIEEILRTELDGAIKRSKSAADEFRSVAADVPTGIPAPDGTFRIERAGAEHRAALRELRRAILELSAFVLHGVAPEDLKNPSDDD